jgi:hypothetical protein
MTKFANPTFNSPANNEKYSDNYDAVFGKPCTKEGCKSKAYGGYKHCDPHLREAGIEPEPMESD